MSTFSTNESAVNSFYLAFYGRPADPAGLKFWSTQLAANNGDMGAIVNFFAASEEAQVRFGTDTVADRITKIYSQLFNRAPDAEGMAFWTNAIEQGHASLADIAMSIQGGAQGSDATLSQLRKQAADAFTAKVEADGTEYSGYASIEAARILVRAVTADATQADLDTLVDAAVSFADTATKTPQVVDAIAVNTTLLALFDTTRGKGEPVALAQALADTAKAAAGDPATLESLLRGGGMDKVLKVMPAKATLQDVVKALADGGLPAAVEVVYPTTPSVPSTPSYKLSFVSVTEGKDDDFGKLDSKADNVTREKYVDVTFGYRGNDLGSGQKYEYRINGGEWVSGDKDIVVNTAANTVVLKHIDLSLGEDAMGPQSVGVMGYAPVDLLSNIELRAVRADQTVIDAVSQQIVYDHYAARPQVSVNLGSTAEHFDGGIFTSIPRLIVEDVETGGRVEYALVNRHLRIPEPQKIDWSGKMPELAEDGEYTILVRQIDAAGNISDERDITFTLDRAKPLAPTVTLQADTGIPGDGVTDTAKVSIAGLETTENTAWEYRVNGGDWTFGERNDGSGGAVLDLGKVDAGKVEVEVRQFDAAGNVGDVSDALSFTFDATPPAYTISFAGVEQGKNDRAPEDKVTNVESAYVEFNYTGAVAEGLHFEYSTDGGKNWLTTGLQDADGVVTISNVDLTAGSPAGNPQGRMSIMEADPLDNLFTTVQLRLVDANAFVYASASETVELDRFAEMLEVGVTKHPSAAQFGHDGAGHTRLAEILVKGLEKGAIVQYANTGLNAEQVTWLDALPELTDGTYTFSVRQRDAAGNNSVGHDITFSLDRVAPTAPALSLKTDSGTAGDGITNVNQVEIGNLEASTTSAWEYRVGKGEWTFGHRNDGSGKAVLTLDEAIDGPVSVEVRQFDAAGNVGKESETLSFTLDTTAPHGSFSRDGIEGASNEDSNVTTLPQADVYFVFSGIVEEGDVFEYSLDGGKWTALDDTDFDSNSGILTIAEVDFSTKDRNIAVRVVDVAGNVNASKTMLVNSTFNNAPPVTITSVMPSFGPNSPKLVLTPSSDSLLLADKTKLSLDSMHTDSPGITPDYFDGTVKMVNNALMLDSMPELGLYQLSWEKGAFTTTKGGDVSADDKLFVAGSVATVVLPGFEIGSTKQVTSLGVDHSGQGNVNTAYYSSPSVEARLNTGDGQDYVADKGAHLTLVYDQLSTTSYDVVIGFDSVSGMAGDFDKIELGGSISNRYDLDHNGKLNWGFASSNSGKYQPAPGVEAVELTGLNSQAFSALMGGATLQALNAALDIRGFMPNTGILILATYEDQSILLSYVEKDGNDWIDQRDLAFIGLFDQGTVSTGDIELVGSKAEMPPP